LTGSPLEERKNGGTRAEPRAIGSKNNLAREEAELVGRERKQD